MGQALAGLVLVEVHVVGLAGQEVVDQVASHFHSRVVAARDDKREQPPPLIRVRFNGRHLQNAEQVIAQAKAVGERFQREGVLGNARVAREILHRTDPHHKMIVLQGVAAAIDRAAGENGAVVEIHGLDLRVVQAGRRQQLAHGGIDLLRLHLAGEHLRNEAVNGRVVVPADDGEVDLAALDGLAQGARQVNRHPAAAQANDAKRFHGCSCFGPSWPLEPSPSISAGGGVF